MYSDDMRLVPHTVHSVLMMLHIQDKFADDFDVNFNNSNSVAIDSIYSERCVSLQIAELK